MEPKPPPRNGLLMWMLAGEMPNSPATRICANRHALARRVDEQAVAVPHRDDRVRLHRVVILRRGLVGRIGQLRSGGEAGIDVAVANLGRIADADHRRRIGLAGIEADARISTW